MPENAELTSERFDDRDIHLVYVNSSLFQAHLIGSCKHKGKMGKILRLQIDCRNASDMWQVSHQLVGSFKNIV
jgi:hypothetical protein